ncbi:MAG: hypothetical protein AVDCRST_MAG55-427 [uncultured Rubrobacteraceae bacterium]|uniref:Acyl-CoA thioesterase n=1 Tax=uncultured Rubrobacteraceae bacterium TaxID=349277 RepID=A0A6J4NVU1_9ACTN|nr:MAG: hypothetical protein AVDCRST_MAG55-427 [uncultured Rubrobacteraceae bacterium]
MKDPPAPVRLEIRYGDLDPYGHVNNAVYLAYFEQVRLAYWRALADLAGIEKLEAGDVSGARFVIAETNLRFKAPVFFEDALHGAATVPWVDNRSYAMHFELRTGEDFQTGTTTCEGSAAHVFFDPLKAAVQHRPGWFLPTVAALEGRPEADFTPPER